VNAVQLQMAGLLSVQWSFTASDVYDIITSDFKYIQKALRYQKYKKQALPNWPKSWQTLIH